MLFCTTVGPRIAANASQTFPEFLKTICSDFAAPIVKFGKAAKTLLTAATRLLCAAFAAKICDCCSQPFDSSFEALFKAILQRCNSASLFVRAEAASFQCSRRKAALLISSDNFGEKGAAYLRVFRVFIYFIKSFYMNTCTKQIDLLLTVWLHSSVGRALHCHCRGQGFEFH